MTPSKHIIRGWKISVRQELFYMMELRLYSEDRYCKFRNLYNIEDYSNELLIANYNISFLQDYLSRDYIWW